MPRNLNLSERQTLLDTKNVQGQPSSKSPYYSGVMLEQPLHSSDIDTTLSVGVFKSRSVIQQPSEDFFHHGLPVWRAALLVVNSALGAGILNFPKAYAQCSGIVTSVFIQMVCVCF